MHSCKKLSRPEITMKLLKKQLGSVLHIICLFNASIRALTRLYYQGGLGLKEAIDRLIPTFPAEGYRSIARALSAKPSSFFGQNLPPNQHLEGYYGSALLSRIQNYLTDLAGGYRLQKETFDITFEEFPRNEFVDFVAIVTRFTRLRGACTGTDANSFNQYIQENWNVPLEE